MLYLTNFDFLVDFFLTCNLLTVASFRVGVPSILFFNNFKNRARNNNFLPLQFNEFFLSTRFDEDGDDESSSKRVKHHKRAEDPYKLQERFFRYGIRPDWLQIQKVLSKQELKDGTKQYFVKWRELPYQDCSWEDEDMDIPEYETFKQYYEDLRYVCGADGKRKKKKKKDEDGEERKRR